MQLVEKSREFGIAANGIEQLVLHQPWVAGKARVGSLLQPFHACPNLTELCPGRTEAVGNMVVHVRPALDRIGTCARGKVVPGRGFDACQRGLRTDVRASRSLHGGESRSGAGDVAEIELREPQVIAND